MPLSLARFKTSQSGSSLCGLQLCSRTTSLSFIAVKMWEPREAHTGVFGSGPTLGDMWSLRDIKDSDKRQKAYRELNARIPLVYVRGGRIDADID